MAWDTTTVDVYLSEVKSEVPAVTEFAILHHTRNVVREFCEKSLYWREELSPQAFDSENTSSVQFDVPAGLDIREITKLELANEDTQIIVTIAVTPERNSDVVATQIVDRFWNEIASGIKARLMLMKDKPWSDPQLGAFHLKKFEDCIGLAAQNANNGYNTTFRNPGMKYRFL